MKTLILNSGKGLLFCCLFLMQSSAGFAQGKVMSVISSVNFEFAAPVVCVILLAVFMLKAFIKQKHH